MTGSSETLRGRYVLLTGASEGLGAAIAQTLVAAGASLAVCARREAPLAALVERLAPSLGPEQRVLATTCDVSRAADVAAWVTQARDAFPHIDALINNAAVLGPIGNVEDSDAGPWQATFAVNLFGTVTTCRAVLAHFKARGYGKIVNLAGGGATAPLPHCSAYGTSKAAVAHFSETLAAEVRGSGIDVNAVSPGTMDTRMTRTVLAAGPARLGSEQHARLLEAVARGKATMQRAASLCAWLCSAASDGISGRLLAAAWDPWESLAARREELAGTDIYTLRRILPGDRGRRWNG